MQGVQFEGLTESLLRLPDVIKSVPDVIRNPQANPLQAAILLGIAVVLVLVVLLSIILVLVRPPEDELEGYRYDEETGEYVEVPVSEEEAEEEVAPSAPLGWLTNTSLIILLALVVWAAAGVTTASDQVCLSCHVDTPHSVAKTDPHEDVSCVECHESGGLVARATVNVVTRFQHVLLARAGAQSVSSYGSPVSSDGCTRCHSSQISGVFYDAKLRVKVSHAQPVSAGARCVDCHALTGGVITAQTVGMSPCLRCHDGKQAKADCSTCHVGDPSTAITPSVPPNGMASSQVPNPQCGGCHKDMTVCDRCHGLRMPHSDKFKAYAHARDAVIDIWFGTGTKCQKCHYPGHNNCIQNGCHQFPIPGGHPNPVWATLHQKTSWRDSSLRCACHQWNPWDHEGMVYCEICHDTKPKNALP